MAMVRRTQPKRKRRKGRVRYKYERRFILGWWKVESGRRSAVHCLSSLVDDVIFAFHCNGIILSQKCAQFGEISCGVFAGDPGFVDGGDFDDEVRFGFLELIHKVGAQRLDIRSGYVMIEIKIEDV